MFVRCGRATSFYLVVLYGDTAYTEAVMRTTAVSIQDFTSRLSHYLKLVKAGHIVEITEQGKPLERRIEASKRAGLLSWNGQKPKPRAPVAKLRTKKTIAEIVIENRS